MFGYIQTFKYVNCFFFIMSLKKMAIVKQNFELDVWIENGENNLYAFLTLLDSYGYIVHGWDIVTQRVSDARYSFLITYYGSDDLGALKWLGDFYQIKNQYKGEVY